MTNHTPEPWLWHEQGDANEYCLLTSGKDWVISFRQNGGLMPDTQRDNARRIVACVNACKGITTETLERVDLPISAICLVSQCAEIGKQRDELLDAIKAVLALPEEQSGRIYRTPTQQFRERQREAYQTLHAAIRKIDSTWGGE